MCILFCTFCRAQLTLNNKLINIKYVLDYIKNDFFFQIHFLLAKKLTSTKHCMQHILNMQDSETLSSLSDEMLRHKNNFFLETISLKILIS